MLRGVPMCVGECVRACACVRALLPVLGATVPAPPPLRTGIPRYTMRWSNRREGRSGGGGLRRSAMLLLRAYTRTPPPRRHARAPPCVPRCIRAELVLLDLPLLEGGATPPLASMLLTGGCCCCCCCCHPLSDASARSLWLCFARWLWVCGNIHPSNQQTWRPPEGLKGEDAGGSCRTAGLLWGGYGGRAQQPPVSMQARSCMCMLAHVAVRA